MKYCSVRKEKTLLMYRSLHYQKTERDMTALDRFLNKEIWHSQVVWKFTFFREYCQQPERQMRSHCASCILLKKRLSYRYRCKGMVPLFGQNPHRTLFDTCTRFYLSTSPSQTRVTEFVFFTTATFAEICKCSSWKRCTYNYFDFFDGTIARICRPVLNERVMQSHHTKMHGVKY